MHTLHLRRKQISDVIFTSFIVVVWKLSYGNVDVCIFDCFLNNHPKCLLAGRRTAFVFDFPTVKIKLHKMSERKGLKHTLRSLHVVLILVIPLV